MIDEINAMSHANIAMETVANAKGSPMMFPRFIVLIPPVRRREILSIWPFILRREGECNDPYDGIGKLKQCTSVCRLLDVVQ